MVYRAVHVRMWRPGGSFMGLSGPTCPNAQHLWLWLLTGPATTALPGVALCGRLAAMEALGWQDQPEAFDACSAELVTCGMAVIDWNHRLIWCPNALSYNPPQSPNVAKAWAKVFDDLPTCELRERILAEVRGYLEGRRAVFAEAFEEALPKAHAKTSSNQDQKQNQEQEQEGERGGCAPVRPADAPQGSGAVIRFPGEHPKPKSKKDTDAIRAYALATGFADWWKVYPIHKDRRDAERAWTYDLKAEDRVRLVNLTQDYLARRERAERNPAAFVPHMPLPATYIRGQRWTDEFEEQAEGSKSAFQDEFKAALRDKKKGER